MQSVSFRTFGWLLVREAFVRIMSGQDKRPRWIGGCLYIIDSPTRQLRVRAERILRLNEARRYYP